MMSTASTTTTARAPTLIIVSSRAGKRRLAQASSCSLANATLEPQNEIEPMIAASTIGISASSGMSSPLAVLDERDQRHRAAADAVEQRHHLRHRGHLHAARGGHADRRADRHADHDQDPVADPRVDQRRDQRDHHADRGDQVAAHRRARPAHHPQADDEQREADDVEQVDPVEPAHSASFFSLPDPAYLPR